jgi:RHS repeat-associated protein
MRSGGRLAAAVFTCCVAMLGACSAVALGSGSASGSSTAAAGSPAGRGSGASSPLGGGLVISGSPTQGEQVRAAAEARRDSPEARIAREKSRTAFAGLSAGAAAKLAGEAFPESIDRPSGGPPQLPVGQRIVGYPADNAAQVDLGGGRHGVIASTAPLAVETSPGRRAPVDLALTEAPGAFQPARSAVALRIPKRLADGVQLGSAGVSLTPIGPNGAALNGSEGTVDGATVLYANTQTDADTVVKPLATGFEEDTLLRSVDSPSKLSFRVGVPAGASLLSAKDGSGAVDVVADGTVIAVVLAPSARDAEGTVVPVSMSVSSGNILVLTVDHRSGEYRYPIAVDPTVVDKSLKRKGEQGNWTFTTDAEGVFYEDLGGEALGIEDKGTKFTEGQYGYVQYKTQGESQIYNFRPYTQLGGDVYNTYATYMAIAGSGGYESGPTPTEIPVCKTTCEKKWSEVAAAGSNENSALFMTIATSSGHGYEVEYYFENLMYGAEVAIVQKTGPSVSFDTTDEMAETVYHEQYENPLYGGRWASGTSGKWGIVAKASDPGLGLEKTTLSSPNAPKWGGVSESCGGNGPQCEASASSGLGVKREAETLPEGEDTIEAKVEDPVKLTATVSTKVKIDNKAPYNLTLSGLPSTHEISDGQHVSLKASAKSGLAGMASIRLTMDGLEVGSPSKGCSTGECTANGEWTLSGESYAAGKYTLDVIATDNAGNVTTEEFQVTIHHAGDVGVGPGSVSPTTGELALSATDVSVGAPDGGLTVARSYRSRHLGVEAESPLGPQWGLSVGASESLSRVLGGSMVLTGPSGEQSVFASSGGGKYTSPPGDASLTLSEKVVGSSTDFLLSENGAVTTFAVPSGGSGAVWEPSISEGAGGTNAITFAYKTEGGITKPTEELAPVPAGVSCSPTLNKGCRALSFMYATKTKESIGEAPSQWGEYKGRLTEVTFTAWEPISKEMKTKAVTEYVYDSQGRLRAEWNPQVSPALKTVYGYDGEGHVTALAPAGQQPWLIEQGTTASDASPGRVLAFARPAATTEAVLKTEMETPAPVIKTAPTLSSTTPTVGVKIGVELTSEKTPGTWSNSPLAYSYQWEDCSSLGKECTAIPGAVNQAYYPVASDEGHTLAVEVVALNADGSGTASSAATGVVAKGTPNTPLPEPPSVGSLSVLTLDYQVPLSGTEAGLPKMSSMEVAKWGQTDLPAEAMAVFPPDKPMGWPAKEYTRASIYYLDGHDRNVNFSSPTGGISTTEYNLYNDAVRTLSPDNRAAALAAGEAKSNEVSKELDSESTYNESGSEPGTELLSTLGPKHTVELTNGTKAEAREHTVYGYNEGAPSEGGPYHLVTTMTDGAQIAGTEEAASVRTTKTSYNGQGNLGWKLRKPTSITVAPSSLSLAHTMVYEAATGNVVETSTPGAKGVVPAYSSSFGKEGKGNGGFVRPVGIAVDPSGNIWVSDYDTTQEFNSERTYVGVFGGYGTKEGDFMEPGAGIATNSAGDVYVVDAGNNRVQEFSPERKFIRTFGFGVSNGKGEAEVCTSGCQAGIAGSGPGQLHGPHGVTVDSSGNVWVVDTENNRVEEFSEKGAYLKQFGSKGEGEGQFRRPVGIALSGGNLYVTDQENDRIEEFSTSGTDAELAHFTSSEMGAPTWIAADPVSGQLYVVDSLHTHIDKFTPAGTFLGKFGSEGKGEGQFTLPAGVAVDNAGDVYVIDEKDDRVERWVVGPNAHDTQTVYYTAGANEKYKACGEHPEWANLPCQTQPAKQPETSGVPNMPVTTATYNIWDEPETTTETVEKGTEKTVRTKTASYDAAGRLKTSAVNSTVGSALPTITDKYSETLGALEEQSNEGKTKPIVSHYNTLGQPTSYTDAAEGTTTYEYDEDGRIKKVNDGKGTETDTYSKTTGALTELLNEYGTTKLAFTGTYDAEGNLLTEGYPNGMNAAYTYNQVGKSTAVVYKKTTNCTEEEKEKCKWFKDAVVPSIHGQWLEQTSTLSRQAYAYDAAGRLIQAQNTPAGKGCTTRIYAYEEETNRTSLTTREPNSKNECATSEEGAKVEKHTYDEANRLTDTGTVYNTFGDITTLPAADAGGKEASENLTSAYYTDNQLASETQNGQTIGYNLDPAGRTLETIATGKRAETVTNHYAGPGSSPAWTVNTAGEWTRNISGIGGFVAVQNSGAAPELELTNLHGDMIAKAYLSETATALASTADTSEFGVPTTSLPPKYSWLGANEIPTELPSGVLDMGARSYVPQIGRFLQPDPISGGSANAYTYTFGDPVNASDPSGESSIQELVAGFAASVAAEHRANEEAELAVRRAAEEAAARETAEYAAQKASWAATWAAGSQYGGGEEEWFEEEWYEEEGEYEYASYHHGAGPEGEEGHVVSAVLVQPLGGEETEGDQGSSTTANGSAVPLCKAGEKGACAKDVYVCNSGGQCHGGSARYQGSQGSSSSDGRGGIWAGTVGHPPAGQVKEWQSERSGWKNTINEAKNAYSIYSCAKEALKTGACSYR